jgi:DNA mismatch repair protein MutL
VKSSVVHSAISSAFEGLLAEGYHPAYYLFLEIEPSKIDVNIHPTKTEIKFEDDASIFRLVRVAVRHALGRNNIAPSIDFELDANAFSSPSPGSPRPSAPSIRVNPNFNPFAEASETGSPSAMRYATEPEPYFETARLWPQIETTANRSVLKVSDFVFFERNEALCALLPQRVFFERSFRTEMSRWEGGSILSQQLLYPEELPFHAADCARLAEMIPGLRMLGYDVDIDPSQGAVMLGIPVGIEARDAVEFLELWLDEPLNEPDSERLWFGRKLALAQKKSASIQFGNSEEELSDLIRVLDSWSWCERDALGRRMWIRFETGDIAEQFEK